MNTNSAKRILIVLLCGIAALLTYYFHGVLKVSSVFTHFFYLPIILSAVWWQRKGMMITVILCLILLSGHLVFGPAYLMSPNNNYFRIIIFLLVSAVVISLSERIENSRKALQAQKDNLEILVGERTKELATVNEELRQKVDDLDHAREAVLQSEAQVRKIIEESPVGIRIIQNDRFVFANTKFVEMFGYQHADEVIGQPIEAFFEPRHADLIKTLGAKRLAGQTIPAAYEIKAIKRSGESFDVTSWLSIIEYQGKPSILGFVVDVSLEKKMRAQIMQSQKRESIGVLAGGIAHKFNNALTLITGSVDLIKIHLTPEHAVHKHISRILNAVRQMTDLNDLMLAYARKGNMWPKRYQLNHLIKETMLLLDRNEIRSSIRTDLSENLPDLLIDAAQIQIVITNILQNAVEATQKEDTITIRTFPQTIDSKTAGMHPGMSAGRYVCLEVEDTGSGMPAETVERIFEPFYTTRFQGRGLGMAAVYGIVKNHEGWVGVASQPGKGTIVTVYFPIMHDKSIEN